MLKKLISASALSLLALTAAVPAAGADTIKEDRTFYLSNTGTGCGADASYQLTTTARTGGSNCGYVGGLPFSEVFTQAGDSSFGTKSYSANDGVPFTLDVAETLEGQVTILHSNGTTGVGQLTIDIRVLAKQGNSTKTLGEGTVERLIVGDTPTSTIPFSFDIDDALAGDYTSLTVETNVRGVHANTGYTSSQGDSFLELPVLIEDEATS